MLSTKCLYVCDCLCPLAGAVDMCALCSRVLLLNLVGQCPQRKIRKPQEDTITEILISYMSLTL